jgi:hypothetical protein
MATAGRRQLVVVFAAAALCGLAAQGVLAQYQPRPSQLPAPGNRDPRVLRPGSVQPVRPGSNSEECHRRWLEYERSQACFEQFRTVTGIKPEAFDACGKDLPDPSAECGARPP